MISGNPVLFTVYYYGYSFYGTLKRLMVAHLKGAKIYMANILKELGSRQLIRLKSQKLQVRYLVLSNTFV